MPVSGRGLTGRGVILRFSDHSLFALNSLERPQPPSPSPDLTALIIDFKRSG